MDGSIARPRSDVTRFKTIVTDKLAAVCILLDKSQYDVLCRDGIDSEGKPIYNERCLEQLALRPALGAPGIAGRDGDPNSSDSSLHRDRRALQPVAQVGQTSIPPIKTVLSYYWLQFLVLAFLIIVITYCVFQWFLPWLSLAQSRRRRGREPIKEDAHGNLSIGKIKFHPDNVLGSGSKGTYVYEGTYENSKPCAVKRIVAENLRLADREIEFLRTLSHENLVRYYATEKDLQFFYISIELAECTLRSLITGRGTCLSEYQLSRESICHQQARGLQYLHELDIVHRDLKPENILISLPKKPNNRRSVMITDFGLSRQLTSPDTCHSSSVMRYFDGTQGWMSPEIIKAKEENRNLTPSKAADIFSLGCVFYFVIFNGEHPFGEAPNEREENIKLNKNQLDKHMFAAEPPLSHRDNSPLLNVMGTNLVRAMIAEEPEQRPPISAVLKHPIFWKAKEQLQFLCDVSDRVEKLNNDPILAELERNRRRVIGFDWKECLSSSLAEDLTDPSKKHRSYNFHKIRDLLRLIRNKKGHYNECSPELKRDLGEPPDGFMRYFTSRFPELVEHVHKSMQELKRETKFRDYYDQTSTYKFRN